MVVRPTRDIYTCEKCESGHKMKCSKEQLVIGHCLTSHIDLDKIADQFLIPWTWCPYRKWLKSLLTLWVQLKK